MSIAQNTAIFSFLYGLIQSISLSLLVYQNPEFANKFSILSSVHSEHNCLIQLNMWSLHRYIVTRTVLEKIVFASNFNVISL